MTQQWQRWHKVWPLLLAAVYVALIPLLAILEDVRGVTFLLGASAAACLLVWYAKNRADSRASLGSGNALPHATDDWRSGRLYAARGRLVSLLALVSFDIGVLLRGLPPVVLWLPLPVSLSWVAAKMTLVRGLAADYDTAFELWLGALGLFAAVFLVPLAVENSGKLPALVRAIRWPEVVAVAFITGVAFAVRFIDLADSPGPIYFDEGITALNGLDVARGVRENFLEVGAGPIQPSLYYATIGLSFKIFGTGVLAARLPSALLGTATVFLLYLMLREMFDRRVALVGAAVLAVFHLHVHYSRVAIINVGDAFLAVLVLYWAFRALRSQKLMDFAFAGVATGLAYYFGGSAGVLPLTMVLVLALVLVRTRGAFVLRNFWGLAIFLTGFVIAFLPAGLQFEENSGRLSQRFEQINIFDTGWLDQQVELTGHGELHVLWDQIQQSFGTLVVYDDTILHYNAGVPLLDGVSGVLFVVGGVYALFHIFQPRFFALYAMLVLTLILGAALLIPPVGSHRLLAATVPVPAAFIALGLVVTADAVAKLSARSRSYAMAGVAAVVLLIAFLNLSFYFDTYVPSDNFGLGRHVDEAKMADYLEGFDDSYAVYIFRIGGLNPLDGTTLMFRARDKVLVDVREDGETSSTFVGGRPTPIEEAAAARESKPNALFLVPIAIEEPPGEMPIPSRIGELEAIEQFCPGEKSEPVSAAAGLITYVWYEVLDAQECISNQWYESLDSQRSQGTVLPPPQR